MNPPVLDAATARAILATLDELKEFAGLDQRQIDLKRKALDALLFWGRQALEVRPAPAAASVVGWAE